jgi:hypothetical protein
MITLPMSELAKLEKYFKTYSKEKIAAINKEVDRTATAIERRAKEDCPVRTGRLRSSIHTITSRRHSHMIKNEESGLIENVTMPFTALPGEAYVGTTVEYASDVEERKIKTKNGRQPFFRPAIEVEQEKFVENIKEILDKDI